MKPSIYSLASFMLRADVFERAFSEANVAAIAERPFPRARFYDDSISEFEYFQRKKRKRVRANLAALRRGGISGAGLARKCAAHGKVRGR